MATIGTESSKQISRAVALAILSTKKFNADEHAAVMKAMSSLRKQHPDWSDEIDERIVTMSNRSAFSKDLAKAGLVTEGDASAWVREIKEQADAIQKQRDAEMEAAEPPKKK